MGKGAIGNTDPKPRPKGGPWIECENCNTIGFVIANKRAKLRPRTVFGLNLAGVGATENEVGGWERCRPCKATGWVSPP